MNLELYKQQSLDLFKRFEIAIPQKKNEQVLQIGNETSYKKIGNTVDSKYLICCTTSATGLIHIREVPSGKCILVHRFNSLINGMSELSAGNLAILWFENRENYLVKFPEGDILYAFTGYVYDVKLCSDNQTFFIHTDDSYFLFKTKNEIIQLGDTGKKIRDVQVSNCMGYALIIYDKTAEVFSLSEGKTLYTIDEPYKIFDASISANSKYVIYSARDASRDGHLKTIELSTGQLVHQHFAILYSPEFQTFSDGWVFAAETTYIYYPAIQLFKPLNLGYSIKTIVETAQKRYLLFIKSYRANDYSDWNKFVVFDIDRLYDSNGEPEPIKQVDYKCRFSDIYVSPDKQLVAVCFPSKAIEIYRTGDFSTLAKIEIEYDSNISLAFSQCSNYLFLSYRNQLLIYDTRDFSLINKPLTNLKDFYYSKKDGLFALGNSLNAIQIRRFDDGSHILNIPDEKDSPTVIALSDKKVWISRCQRDNYYLQAIELQNGAKTSYQDEIYHLNRVEGDYIIGKTGIINTITNHFIPVAGLDVFFNESYFYCFNDYSAKICSFSIDIYDNRTGLLIKKVVPPLTNKLGHILTICGHYIVYETQYAQQTYIESLLDNQPATLLFDYPIRKIAKIDDRYFLVTNYRVNPDITDVYIFDIQQLNKPMKELALEGNLYNSDFDAPNQRMALSSLKICWYIDLKNTESPFSINEEGNLGTMLFDDILVKVSANNKLQYYNTNSKSIFKPGELLATLYTIPDGYLWVTPPDAASPSGWFWTDKPEYIEVMQYSHKKSDYELLPKTSVEWQKYIELHNRKDMVMARLHNSEAYNQNLFDLQGKMQHMQLQHYKHTLMLNS